MFGPSPGRMRPIATALAALSMTSGCSFLFVQPAPDDSPGRQMINCTTSQVAPVVDTILTVTNLFSVFYVASENNVSNRGTAVGVGLSVATVWLSSAIYGFYSTSQCEDLLRDDDQGPYQRPIHFHPTGYRPPSQRPLVAIPAEDHSEEKPARPPVEQQRDDERGHPPSGGSRRPQPVPGVDE